MSHSTGNMELSMGAKKNHFNYKKRNTTLVKDQQTFQKLADAAKTPKCTLSRVKLMPTTTLYRDTISKPPIRITKTPIPPSLQNNLWTETELLQQLSRDRVSDGKQPKKRRLSGSSKSDDAANLSSSSDKDNSEETSATCHVKFEYPDEEFESIISIEESSDIVMENTHAVPIVNLPKVEDVSDSESNLELQRIRDFLSVEDDEKGKVKEVKVADSEVERPRPKRRKVATTFRYSPSDFNRISFSEPDQSEAGVNVQKTILNVSSAAETIPVNVVETNPSREEEEITPSVVETDSVCVEETEASNIEEISPLGDAETASSEPLEITTDGDVEMRPPSDEEYTPPSAVKLSPTSDVENNPLNDIETTISSVVNQTPLSDEETTSFNHVKLSRPHAVKTAVAKSIRSRKEKTVRSRVIKKTARKHTDKVARSYGPKSIRPCAVKLTPSPAVKMAIARAAANSVPSDDDDVSPSSDVESTPWKEEKPNPSSFLDNSYSEPSQDLSDGEFKKEVIRSLNFMKSSLANLTHKMNYVLDRVFGSLIEKSVVGIGADQSNPVVQNLLSQLPLQTEEDLEAMEETLTDPHIQELFIHEISQLGGCSLIDVVKRILKTILSDPVASKYSWLGLKKKKVFSKLNLRNVIFCAARRSGYCQNGSDPELENIVKNWLRHARQRSLNKTPRADPVHLFKYERGIR